MAAHESDTRERQIGGDKPCPYNFYSGRAGLLFIAATLTLYRFDAQSSVKIVIEVVKIKNGPV